jgi:hypothetical protein
MTKSDDIRNFLTVEGYTSRHTAKSNEYSPHPINGDLAGSSTRTGSSGYLSLGFEGKCDEKHDESTR